MTHSLSLRPRALAEIEEARGGYALVGHAEAFLAELELILDAIRAMPLRFPIVGGSIAIRSLCSSGSARARRT